MSATPEPITRRAVIDGLHVETYGDPHAPALLMSAGLGGSGSYWSHQVAAFSQSRYVILYDHRGTGGSDRADLPPGYSVFHMAEDIRAVLDGLGVKRADVIGHAAGGVAGLALAARFPERVASVTVINGWLRPSRHFRRCMEVRRSIFLAGGAEAYLRAQPIYLYPAVWIEQNFDRLEAERRLQSQSFQSEKALFARMDALIHCDLSSETSNISAPICLLASADDALVPVSASQELMRALHHARLDVFPSGGHAVNVTEPARFNKFVLSFIQ